MIALLFVLAGVTTVDTYVEGRPVANIVYVDEHGASHSTQSWRGRTVIVAPIFTRCPIACPLIVHGLRDATLAAPGDYDVLLFSFDPRDTPDDLRRFRTRQRVPASWHLGSSTPADTRRLMDSLGFHYAQTRTSFSHPNVIIAVSPAGKVAMYGFGTKYDIAALVDAASGHRTWLDRYGAVLLVALVLTLLGSAAYGVFLLGQRRHSGGQTIVSVRS